jgi:predicted transcriptional regulator
MASLGLSEKSMVLTTVSLEPELYRKLRHLAVDENVSVRELIRRAVGEYMERKTRGRKQR